MAITKDQIDSFHRFAVDRLDSGPVDLEIDELLVEWYDSRERESINGVIRQGLADIEAARGRSAREVSEELALLHGIGAQ